MQRVSLPVGVLASGDWIPFEHVIYDRVSLNKHVWQLTLCIHRARLHKAVVVDVECKIQFSSGGDGAGSLLWFTCLASSGSAAGPSAPGSPSPAWCCDSSARPCTASSSSCFAWRPACAEGHKLLVTLPDNDL